MANRSADWQRQGEADLRLAGHARAGEHYDWACLAAHQAAEKATKALLLGRGAEAWGQSVTRILAIVREDGAAVPDALLASARLLDRQYIPTRYPDNLPDGAPTDYYQLADADDAIRAAETIVAHSRSQAR